MAIPEFREDGWLPEGHWEATWEDMIENASQLNASLHQLSSMVDSLQAAHLDCERRNDWRLFPLMSAGLVIRIRELNADIREYLQAHSDSDLVAPGAPRTGGR